MNDVLNTFCMGEVFTCHGEYEKKKVTLSLLEEENGIWTVSISAEQPNIELLISPESLLEVVKEYENHEDVDV